jgi:hypothetical protein
MAKQSVRKNSSLKADAAVASRSITAWGEALSKAAVEHTNASRLLLELVLEARRSGFDVETVVERVRDAFLDAGCAELTAKMRGSEAKTIMTLPEEALAGAGGGSVQTFAKSARENAKAKGLIKGRERAPQTPKPPPVEGDPAALADLRAALERVRAQAAGKATALELISEIADLLDDVATELLADDSE